MAVRLRNYKEHAKVILLQSTFMHIDMATVNATATATAPWLFNLYIDPQEELPVGHCMNALARLARRRNGRSRRHVQAVSAEEGRALTFQSSHEARTKDPRGILLPRGIGFRRHAR
jgi:hypothetical protein